MESQRNFRVAIPIIILLSVWAKVGKMKNKNKPQAQAVAGMEVVVFPFPSGCSSRTKTPCGGKS
jgi:hypothetical protein